MRYGHLTIEQLNQGLIGTAEALEGEAKFMRSIAEGGFKFPKNADARAQLVASHQRTIEKLKKDHEDLLEALGAKESENRPE